MGGAVYISSCQNTKNKILKKFFFEWIAIKTWLNACSYMPDQGFPKRDGGFPISGGGGKFCFKDLIYMIVETWRKWFWPFKPFSRPKTSTFCKYCTLIKIKTGLTCAYKEYEVKIKVVQVQWLQPKMKFLVCYNINFRLVKGGLPLTSPVGKTLPTCVKFN